MNTYLIQTDNIKELLNLARKHKELKLLGKVKGLAYEPCSEELEKGIKIYHLNRKHAQIK